MLLHLPIVRTQAIRRAARMLVLLAALQLARQAHAVTFIEQAQRLEDIYAGLIDLRPGAPPNADADPEHPWTLGAELIPIPSIDNRVGGKREPVQTPPAIPRVRATWEHSLGAALGADALSTTFGATLSLPVPVLGWRATWAGGDAALNARYGGVIFSLRAFALDALIVGPITSSGASDQFSLLTSGADLRVGIAPGPWRFYAGAGAGHLDAELMVDQDGARIREQTGYSYLLGGVAYQWRRWLFTFEQEATEDYLRHVIVGASWRF